MSRRLGVGLFLAVRAVNAVQGSVFDRVVTALEGAMDDAVAAQKANDDEFKKTECQATELIDEAKMRIPQHQETIEKMTVKQKELRSDNEFLSGEAFELDESVSKMTSELANKQQVRTNENTKYTTDKGDFETAANQLGRAITTLTEGTANLLQVTSHLAKKTRDIYPGQTSLLQTAAKTGSSGQVIGILTKLKEQFESNLMTIEAKEKEAASLFAKYKDRTTKQIASESAQSQSNKNRIADNQIELNGVQLSLKSNKRMLGEMKEQLKTQSELLAEHKEFHATLTAESEALKEAIQGAITLLTSNDAQNTMSKASDHMNTPVTLLQVGSNPQRSFLTKLATVRKHDATKAAGDYGWDAIFTALDDMTATVTAEQSSADEKFETCEMQLKQHHDEKKKLKASKAKNTLEKIAAEDLIEDMEEAIKLAKDEISKSTKEIKDTTNDIRDANESLAKETKEAQDASALFKQAIAFLKNYKSNSDLKAPESGSAAYSTATMSAGTDQVVSIIETVETDMMKEISDLKTQTETNVGTWETAIADAKDRIKTAKETIGTSTTEKANGEAAVSGANVFLQAADEGLAAEAEWWGPAPGHKLPSPGQDCITYLGKVELGSSGGREGDYTAADKMAGDGQYHLDSKTNNDELAALGEMKSIIEGIKNDYLVAQPAGSV
jgi:chromosome segregation ATPase